MTEVLHAPLRDSRHRSISPHRRPELGKDCSPYRSSPGIVPPSGKPPLVRASTNSSIILRHHHHNRQREESPLLTNRREAKKLHVDNILQSEVSPLSILQTDSSHTTGSRNNNTIHGLGRLKVQNEMATSSPCLPKLSSPTSTPPVARRRAWTMGSNKHLKSALNSSPSSSPAVVRKKRNSSSPKFHFASLPSSRQSSPKSSASRSVRDSKTVTILVVTKGNKQITQQQPMVESSISKNEKNVHIVASSGEGDNVVNEQEQNSDNKAVVITNNNNNPEMITDEIQKPEKVGESQQNTNKSSDDNDGSSGKKKSLPEGLSEDVYERCVHWLEGVRAADDDKCLDVVTQPDLQWKD